MPTDGGDIDEFVVVGGGIGGLAAALALAVAGRQVRVLERASRFAEIGAGLQLAPNATRLLDRWGLLDRLLAVGHRPSRLVLADALRGTELAWLDLGTPFLERYGAPYVVAHRSDLHDLLLEGCRKAGVALEPARDVTEVVPDADGVTVRSADGRTNRCLAVVAADGLHSRLRALLSDDEPICSGYVAYRGAIPIDSARHRADLDDVVAWIGPGVHFVQYTLRAGALYNQVAVFRSERYRQGAADWGGPDELAQAFDTACPHVRGAAEDLRLDARWPMYDREPIDRWVAGDRVALLGDAAHPMLQYLAQGACQALEDADALARAVAAQPDDLAAALAAYTAERAPHTARVQRNARVWGDLWHADGLTAALRDDGLAGRSPTDYGATDWLYGAAPDQRASSPARAHGPYPTGRR
ncbi:FAD-dependent monooxygenase [Phytohabitans kaempferiae]|uniref:FAD-dependent monooxygenase n=1 Tax=Phytohabitans kaempferiae TaxID=1620943 RepID=A0ABV6LZ25_9ACTN